MASMHYEGPFVHACLGGAEEVLVRSPAGPSGVDVCIRSKDGLEL